MIQIQGRDGSISSSPAVSLLNLLQRNSVPIQTICGGRAQCGRCLIRVLKGADKMNKKNQREIIRLQALNAEEDMRLACQSYARGDIEIEIINPGNRADGGTAG
ncbi:MAG: (2Fe-2S)-binding protein [Spirochaetaceae bacterium]|nr:MAG: (2Fe-2S)-binding protein [Spirochaetaceae bacterium]